MISEKIYHEQMQKLEGLMNYKISDLSFKSWKEALEEEDGFTDKHLIAGISKIKNWLEDFAMKLRPQDINYGTLARACTNVRRDYILSEEERKKRVVKENEEAKKNTITDILQRGKSIPAQAYCNNLNDYTNGLIDRLTWLQKQKALQRKYMGKHQAILDREIKKCTASS